MHGHYFWIIASNLQPFAEVQYADNYIRRDTVTVQAHGKLRIISLI